MTGFDNPTEYMDVTVDEVLNQQLDVDDKNDPLTEIQVGEPREKGNSLKDISTQTEDISPPTQIEDQFHKKHRVLQDITNNTENIYPLC